MEKINGKHLPEEEKPEIIYVYDALCGWCYGFSPVMNQVFEKFQDRADFLILSGGMITDDRIGPIREVAPYIKNAYKTVETTTGIAFGERFLNDVLEKGEAVFTSIPPAKALAVFRILNNSSSLQFASEIQKAIYFDGIDVQDHEAYARIAVKFGVNRNDFLARMIDIQTQELIVNEFKMASGLGVRAYPTVLLRNGEKVSVISTGYRDFDKMNSLIENALSKP